MALTKSQLAAENAALRTEINALRFTLNELRAAQAVSKAQRLSASRVAMNAAREEAMRTGRPVKVTH